MLKTSLGKNIYPTPIENTYLQSEKIEQIFIIGDKREYVTAIVIPKEDQLKDFYGLNGLLLNEDTDVIEETAVKQWLQEDMKRLSLELSNFARVRDFIVKRKPFSVESGELTVTLKQKRKIIEDNYKVWIEKLYQS